METEIIVFVGIIAAAILVFFYVQRSRKQAWSNLAAQTGLTFEGVGLFSQARVTGTYRGRNLVLETFTTGGKNSKKCTRIIASVNNTASIRLRLTGEGILAKIGKKFGGQDIQTGNTEIDKRFLIKGEPEREIQALLTSSEVRQKLLSVPVLSLEVMEGEIRCEQDSFERNTKRLQDLFELLCVLAEGIEKNKTGAE